MTHPLQGARRVAVRIAPSLRFTYVEQKLLPLFLLFRPPAAAPSLLADAMPLGEFARRMQHYCRLPPLVYGGRECYYMQTPLWPALLPDVDLAGPPFSAVTHPGVRPRSYRERAGACVNPSQANRRLTHRTLQNRKAVVCGLSESACRAQSLHAGAV